MTSAGRFPRRLAAIAILCLGLVAALLWQALPAVNQDELLPLFPLTEFSKEAEARSSILAAYSRTIAGVRMPVQSYPYEGAVQAYLFLALRLPTTPAAVRFFHLAVLALSLLLLLVACWRLSSGDRGATWACLALFLSDLSLVVLGVTGLARSDLLFAAGLVVLLNGVPERRRPWLGLAIAAVVFLGVWHKLSHLWFVAAGLAGSAAAALAGRSRRRLVVLGHAVAGVALGLLAVGSLVPDYPRKVWESATRGLSSAGAGQLWDHARLLIGYSGPFSAFHRYVDVSSGQQDAVYAACRWGLVAIYLAATGAALGMAFFAFRRRRASAAHLGFIAACLAVLPILILLTREAWAAHHVVVLRPHLYLGLAVVAAHLGRFRRWALGALLIVALVSAAAGVRGVRDLTRAPQVPGTYNVSWNADDAWRHAAASGVAAVFALDWGVFYPGVVNSPAAQRWEMASLPDSGALGALRQVAPGSEIGLLLKSAGAHGWLLREGIDGGARVVSERRFTAHAGEPWAFVVADAARWSRTASPAGAPEPGGNLLENPRFESGAAGWQTEKWEETPGGVELAVGPCPTDGERAACAELRHEVAGDSRFVQEVRLEPRRLYEINGRVRCDGVDAGRVGAHLGLMEFYGYAESEKLTGTTGWQRLRFFVFSGETPRSVRVAARLGTFGSPNTGSAWFTDLAVREVSAAVRGVPVYELDLLR